VIGAVPSCFHMEPRVEFLADLTVALAAAALGGFIASRLRLNPILGYLAAGVAIGPFTPGYVAGAATLDTLATLGLIFLLFSLGLGFSFREIRMLGALPLAGNVVVMAVIAVVAAFGARLIGAVHPITMALTTAVSSTAVGAALLREWDVEDRAPGRFAIAQLVVQDLVAVALLVVTTAPAASLSVIGVALPVLKAVGFVAVALVLGATVLPRVVRRVLAHGTSDVLFAAFAALALVAAWLGYLAGLSFEFGAFVAGAVISEAAGSRMVASVVAPFRALFVALFFVSVGMLLDPRAIAVHWTVVAGLGFAFVVVRFALWSVLARISGLAFGAAVLAAIALTSLGEFNVVLINEAARAHRLGAGESQVLLGITILSIALTVVAGPFAKRVRGLGEKAVELEGDVPEDALPLVAIVGYGRVGRTVGMVLRHAGIPFAAVERDREAVARAHEAGENVVVGDGMDPAALDRIVRPSTRIVLTTLPDGESNAAVAHRFSERPEVVVIARARRGAEVAPLRERGATLAFVPESEGALVFARAVLLAAGVEAEVADRELDAQRERSRALADPA
jgi:CPA2 family monovalent cation:H+ antiporter-2